MKKRSLLSRLMLLSFSLIGGLFCHTKSITSGLAATVDEYYTTANGINITGQSGSTLRSSLTSITTTSHTHNTSYDDIRVYTKYSDADPNISGNIILFYCRGSVSGAWDSGVTWNREHVWPQNLSGGLYGTSGAGSDLHHLRPTDTKINSTRSNSPYGEVEDFTGTVKEITYNNAATGNYYIGTTVFEPRDDIKGDTARILMYLYTRYYTTGKLVITNIITTASKTESAAWSLLLKWNAMDPVDDLEIARNDYIYSLQGNRNPFIDHAEFADMCFDPSYSGEGALVDTGGGSGGDIIDVTGVSVSPTTLSLKVGGTGTLKATVSPTNATNKSVQWSSANSSIAKVDANGLVTGVSKGETTITAQSGNYTASATVTIEESTSGGDVDTYTQVTSISQIDASQTYVLGNSSGYHSSGTSSWGKVSTIDTLTPLSYTLSVVDAANSTFRASTIVNGSTYYLTVPTSNTFTMTTSATDDTIIKLGSDGQICNATTTTRFLRLNGTNGIRSYASATGTIVYFYQVPSTGNNTDQEKAEAFIARLDELTGIVTLADEATIQSIENDYANLTSSVKTIVDDLGYAEKLAELKAELLALHQQNADVVIRAIDSLPDPDLLTSANYTSYQTAINDAKTTYDDLNDAEKQLVTNYAKLENLLNKIVALNPDPVLVTDTTFNNGATLPEGWEGNGNVAFATTCMALKVQGNYLLYHLEGSNIASVTVQIYSVTNSTSAINEVTVYGLDGSGASLSQQSFNPYSTSATNAAAVKNACSEANSKTVTLQGNISDVKIELTTRNANWVVYQVKISCVYAATSALDDLIAKMNALNTCDDYNQAAALREQYNSLSDEEKAIFDATICSEDSNCTMAQKLAYMEYLMNLNSGVSAPSNNKYVLKSKDVDNLLFILLFGGLSVLLVYSIVSIKKRRKSCE